MKLSTNPLWQSSIIISSLLFVIMWNKSPLSLYSSQLIALLVFVYIFSSLNKKLSQITGEYLQTLQMSIFIVVAALLVISSGSMDSPLFFLLYFIPFATSLVFKPQTVFILSAGLVAILLLEGPQQNLVRNLPILGSLLFLSPLAFYFGREFQKARPPSNLEEVTQKIDSDVEKIITTQKDTLSTESIQNLEDIVEQAEKLSTKDEK